jgi:hypothetical protein
MYPNVTKKYYFVKQFYWVEAKRNNYQRITKKRKILFFKLSKRSRSNINMFFFADRDKMILKYIKNVSNNILAEETSAQNRLYNYYHYL